jgi:hypothetical protein
VGDLEWRQLERKVGSRAIQVTGTEMGAFLSRLMPRVSHIDLRPQLITKRNVAGLFCNSFCNSISTILTRHRVRGSLFACSKTRKRRHPLNQ